MSIGLAVQLIAGFGRDFAHPIVFEQYAGQLRLLQLNVKSAGIDAVLLLNTAVVVHFVLLVANGPSFLLATRTRPIVMKQLFENDQLPEPLVEAKQVELGPQTPSRGRVTTTISS